MAASSTQSSSLIPGHAASKNEHFASGLFLISKLSCNWTSCMGAVGNLETFLEHVGCASLLSLGGMDASWL